MQTEFVATYRYMRDHAKPITERDAADLAKIRAPQPPSRAHIKRIQRPVHDLPPETRKPLPAPSVQYEFFKRQMASVGGTRTIASSVKRTPSIDFIGHPASREL